MKQRLAKIPPFVFLGFAVFFAIVAVLSLRANNEKMIELRKAVYVADEKNGDTDAALRALQTYVTRHMNTDLSSGGATGVYPPVQLKYTYNRLVTAQGEAANQANTRIYSEAQAFCEQQNSSDVSGRNRVPCIQKYVQENNTTGVQQIPDALYKFAFTSPKWSPDLAGWSIVLAVLSTALFIITFAIQKLSRRR